MNYDHLNKIHVEWKTELLPYLHHRFPANSFDDYLKRFAYIPHGKWIKECETVKFTRVPLAMSLSKFVKKYEDVCVTYNTPVKAEDGIIRAIYQISPTLHAEAAFWVWVEHEILQSYATIFTCFNNEKEHSKFIEELFKIRCEGNTEKAERPGFAGLSVPIPPKEKVGFNS